MRPSREFMIMQSVLNACVRPEYLQPVSLLGVPGYLPWVVMGDYVRDSFCAAVRSEYRKLQEKYQ